MRMSRGAWARVIPFGLFMLLLALRGSLPEDGSAGVDPRWVYGVGVLLVGSTLWCFRREYGELAAQMRPSGGEMLLAVAVGVVVFGLWIVLDAPWMKLGQATANFVPLDADGRIDWLLVTTRFVGAALLVPVMEELFWRSFLMRWLERAQFETLPPQRVGVKAVMLSTFVFTLAHTLWLAAVIAGLAYAWLYVRTGKLWVPIVSHATTNGALGTWVVATGNWTFW